MGVGFLEIVVIGVFALILFGPSKLPEMMRQAARYYVQFRRASNEFKGSFDHMLRDAENSIRTEEIARLKSLVADEISKLNGALEPKLESTLGTPPAMSTVNSSTSESASAKNNHASIAPPGVPLGVPPGADGTASVLSELSPRSNQPFEWDKDGSHGHVDTKKVEL
jgi:Tat protein translocase TatB subunit